MSRVLRLICCYLLLLGAAPVASSPFSSILILADDPPCRGRGWVSSLAEGQTDSTYFAAFLRTVCNSVANIYLPRALTVGKLDANGDLIWERTTRPSVNPDGGTASGTAIATLSDGSFVVVGEAYFGLSITQPRALIARYGADGTLIWERLFEVPPSPPLNYALVAFSAVAVGAGDRIYATGTVNTGTSNISAGLYVNLDQNGQVLVSQRVSSPNRLIVAGRMGLAVNTDGSAVASFVSRLNTVGSYHIQLIKFSGAGSILWQREIGTQSSSEGLAGLFVESDGKIVTSFNSSAVGGDAYVVLRLTSTGLQDARTAVQTYGLGAGQIARVGDEYQLLVRLNFGATSFAVQRMTLDLDAIQLIGFPPGVSELPFGLESASNSPSGWRMGGSNGQPFNVSTPSLIRLGPNLERPEFCGAPSDFGTLPFSMDTATLANGQLIGAPVQLTIDSRQLVRLPDLLDSVVSDCPAPPAPRLRFESAEMNFTDVSAGSCGDKGVSILNSGAINGQVSAVSLTGALEYSVLGEDCTPFLLPPGARCSIDVRFCPLADGDYIATLSATSDDPIEPIALLPIFASVSEIIFRNGFD